MRKRLLRWLGIGLGSLVGLTILAYGVLYAVSELVLRRTYEIPTISLSIPTDAVSITEGRRLATIHGCVAGCHGANGEGQVLFDEPMIGRLIAPNLTHAVRKYSDPQLAVAIRKGLRPDGRSLVVMPSEAFVELSDADLSRIIAFLRSLPPVAGPAPSLSLRPLGRAGLAIGKFKPAAQLIAETVPPPDATDPEAAYGRYLARTTCAHCHGTSLRGNQEHSPPRAGIPEIIGMAGVAPQPRLDHLSGIGGVALEPDQLGVADRFKQDAE